MIEYRKTFVSGNTCYAKLEDAQTAEIKLLLADSIGTNGPSIEDVAAALVANRERVADILTTTGKSRPRARVVNGGKKGRKGAKARPEAGPTLPFVELGEHAAVPMGAPAA